MDRRLTPANARVAHESLRGTVEAGRYTSGKPGRIGAPTTDLREETHGPRVRQLLMGDQVTILETTDHWNFVRSEKDGYCGYVARCDVVPDSRVSHSVIAAATHAYAEPDIKSADVARVPFGASVLVLSEAGAFAETPGGYIPSVHIRPIDEPERDPVAVAKRFLGTPYLWGGNSRDGIDCSGLIQAACLACGVACPGDSDLQERALGADFDAGEVPEPADLLFWKGHVAMVADAETLIHANAHHMSVVLEPLNKAVSRIHKQGGGPVTRRARLEY